MYLGNKNTMEVHNLSKQTQNCQINEIKFEHRKYFTPDTLEQAHKEGFDNCAYCIGNSKR
jgi:hypothetical protein